MGHSPRDGKDSVYHRIFGVLCRLYVNISCRRKKRSSRQRKQDGEGNITLRSTGALLRQYLHSFQSTGPLLVGRSLRLRDPGRTDARTNNLNLSLCWKHMEPNYWICEMSKVLSCVAQKDLKSMTMPEIHEKSIWKTHIPKVWLKNIATHCDGRTHGWRLNLQMCWWFLMFLNKLFKMTYN